MRLYGEIRPRKERKRYTNVSNEELLAKLVVHFNAYGNLSIDSFSSKYGMPDRTTYAKRFGSSKIGDLAALANIVLPTKKYGFGTQNGKFKSQKEAQIASWLEKLALRYEYEVPYGVGKFTFIYFR